MYKTANGQVMLAAARNATKYMYIITKGQIVTMRQNKTTGTIVVVPAVCVCVCVLCLLA